MHVLKQIIKTLLVGGFVVFATPTQMVSAAAGDGPDARQGQVKMSFSGSSVPTSIDVQPDTITDEELLAGNGSLGSFTFRKLRTDATTPQGFGSCGDGFGPSLRVTAAGGVLRFEDGSLLIVSLTDGVLCVDLDHLVGHLTETYQVTGGTGRFKSASGGVLQLTGKLKPVMFTAAGGIALLTSTRELKGTVRAQSERE